MTSATNPLLDWALYFAAMDWHLITLRPGTKLPTGHAEADCPGTGRCAGGHETPERRASTDRNQIRAVWATQAFNIGLATGPSGLVVVDLDTPKPGEDGPHGEDAFAALAAERGGPIPDTYAATTPSGGKHLYYRAPAGVRLRSTQKTLAPNVDTRAWGGYVVAPGSVRADGAYELVDDRDPAELPAWIVQACCEKAPTANSAPVQIRSTDTTRYGTAALAGECRRVRDATPGAYNQVLSTAAYTIGRKVGAGLVDHTEARAALIAAGETLVSTKRWPRTASEVTRVVDAGLTAGAANPIRRAA